MNQPSAGRPNRIAEQVRKEIADLLTKEVKDPRIGFVSIMEVRMSRDLRYANLYVSVYGDEKARKDSLIGLRQSAGWLRRELGKRIRIRYTPELRFFEDNSLDRVFHLDEVLRNLHQSEDQPQDAGPAN